MKRTRWAGRVLGGLLAVASANGCKQQLFLEPSDYQDAAKGGTAAFLEARPDAPITPGLVPGAAPATVLDPARPARPLRLPEAIAIALENGTGAFGTGSGTPGTGSEAVAQFNGRGTGSIDSIRAFALDPAVAAAEVERALSKFDARFINSITWNKVDQPVLSLQQSFANGDTAQLTSTLAKPLPTGGVAGITFTTNYQKLSTPPQNSQFVTLNTAYTPSVQFSFEQPLLQGFGVEINQLLGTHPGSQLLQLRPSGGSGSEGILITRIRLDQQRAQFDFQLNNVLLNVEAAYWTLLSSYYNLTAQEEGLKQSLDSYTFYRARSDRGLNREQVALQALAQYYNFARSVITARGQVLESERQLRLLLNMRSDDGTRLVPVDDLIQAPYSPDIASAVTEAIANRPDLLIQRQELKAKQLNVLLQKNLRRPDLRFLSTYNVAGLGERLDGANTDTNPNRNALESLRSNQFNSYTLGLRLDMPLGFRDANALVRQAQVQLQQEAIKLEFSERKVAEQITRYARQVVQLHREAELNRAARKTQEKYVELDKQVRDAGAFSKEEASSFVLNLIQSQTQLAQSTAQEFASLANYNISLAGLEFAKGTIQQYNRVTVAEGALPAAVGKKAADHFAAREAAIDLRQHPADGPAAPQFLRPPMTDADIAAQAQAAGVSPLFNAAPAPAPAKPAEPAPAPKTADPKETGPLSGRPVVPPYPTTPAVSRPQLVPADATPGSFSPIGSVTLPTRAPAAAPPVNPTTPVMVPLPR